MKTKLSAVPSWSECRWIHTGRGDALAATAGFGCSASAFYLPHVPLSIALVGLVVAGQARTRRRFAIVLGWHIAAAWPAMLGLWNLGSGAAPLVLLILWLGITTLVFTVLGPGVGVLISLAFPWHIGSAVLAAGELWPGTRELGLVLIPAMLCGLSARRRAWRASALIGAMAISGCAWWAWKPVNSDEFLEKDLDISPAVTTTVQEMAVIAQLPNNSVVWLGENIVSLKDRAALSRWCSYAAQLRSELFVGALERNNRSTIRSFAPYDCRANVIYERRFGLPGISGGTGIGAGQLADVTIGGRSIRWLICFEAFLPSAWSDMSIQAGSVVVIVTNDRWTHPVPVDVARRKVVRSMAQLWTVAPVLAETGRSTIEHAKPVDLYRSYLKL